MNKRDEQALKYFLEAYKTQYDLNQYYRDQYDEDLEYYVGYRDETKYPLAYDMTFNQLLPRIMTMASRMMGQLYQGGAANLISVRPNKRRDVERAPRVEGLLNHQLQNLNNIDETGGSYLFNLQWLLNALSWGKGIAKCYWRKEERIGPLRKYVPQVRLNDAGAVVDIQMRSIVETEAQIVYDAPYAEVIHNKLFVPNPLYKSIQKMPFVFCVYRRSVDYLKEMQKKGIYKNLKDMTLSSEKGNIVTSAGSSDDWVESYAKSVEIEDLTESSFSHERKSPEVDIIEGYGKYIFPEDDAPYEVGSGVKIKGKESDAIVHIGNYHAMLKIQKNTYGFKPFFDIGCYRHPELYWDMGIIRLGKAVQEQYNTLANTRYQGALQQVAPMLQVRYDADIDPEALIWKPFGLVPVEEMNTDVQPLVVPDTQSQIFREQEDFFKSTIEDMTGMYRYNMGETPTRQENVGTIYSLQQMGEARTKLLLMTMDYQGFQPLLRYFMLLNTWHLSDDFEARINTNQGDAFTPMFPGDLHPEYDFTVRYTSMEPALGKQFKAQQLIQYAQMWQQSPYLQHYEFMKAIMEMMDFHATDKFLKTPQQVQQEQQAMMQAAALQQTQAASIQNELATKSDERAMMRDLAKGIMK